MNSAARWILTTTVSAVVVSAAAAGTLSLDLVGHGSCRQANVELAVESAATIAEHRARLKAGQALVRVTVPEESPKGLTVRAQAKGCWAAPLEIGPGRVEGQVDLWPAGSVSGAVEVEDPGVRKPRRLSLSLRRAPEADHERQPPNALLTCEVTGGQVAGCPVPAGRWSVRIQADGWSPVYRWGIEVSPGRSASLGKLIFRRGGSIVGEVATEDDPPEALTTVVTVSPLMDGTSLPEADRERLQHLELRTTARPTGEFGLSGVPPGRYIVRAEGPPYAPASAVVDVEKARETLLDSALILRRPVRLEVDVTPETGPGGAAWTIDLLSQTEGHELERADGGSTRDGRWTSSPLPPGVYWLHVLGPEGNRLAKRRVDIEEDLQREEVDLELVVAHGTVVLGEREIAARLWFGGRTGETSIETKSELDLGFEVMLPHPGTWKVDVLAEDPPVDRQGVQVTVDAGSGGESDDVEVRLPDTTLQGDVVDENELPVTGAAVHVVRLDPFSQAALWTDETGWFEDHGLDPGRYELQAVLDDMRSDRVQVDLGEGTSVPLHLVLRRTSTLRGRIVAPSGMVRGAGVLGYPLARGGGMASTTVPKAASDANGRFELELPAQAETVRLVALAPGYVLAIRRVAVKGGHDEEIEVPVRQGGGTLVIDWGRSGAATNFAVVYIAGEPVDLPLLKVWAGMNRGESQGEDRLRVPGLPAGEYAVCRVTPQEAVAVIGGLAVPKESACSRGELLEGSTLELTLP